MVEFDPNTAEINDPDAQKQFRAGTIADGFRDAAGQEALGHHTLGQKIRRGLQAMTDPNDVRRG